MSTSTKLVIEIAFWAAFTIVYWAILYFSPTYYAESSPEYLFGLVLTIVATIKITNRWRKL